MKGLSYYFPNGASEKQRKEFRNRLMKGECLSDAYKKWTVEERCLDEELSMLEMLDSCFAYGGVSEFYRVKSYNHDKSYYETYLKSFIEEGGSKLEFDKMLEIQKVHLTHCSVRRSTYTDSEGCTYNSIVDYDEEIA